MKKAIITCPAGTTVTSDRNPGENATAPEQDTVTLAHEELVVSDGYHTFDELYDHRVALYIALGRKMKRIEEMAPSEVSVWRSKLHDDGTMFEGWYIMGITSPSEGTITYHLPESSWSETDFADTLERAPKWDGHTPADVLARLKNI